MHQVILDTDILSEILKQKDASVAAKAAQYAQVYHRFTFTAISVHEILFGLECKRSTKQLEDARTAFEENDIVVPTLEDYEVAALIRARARKQGQQLALDDCLIATIAARLQLPVVTGNTEHFQAAQGAGLVLTIENWRTA